VCHKNEHATLDDFDVRVMARNGCDFARHVRRVVRFRLSRRSQTRHENRQAGPFDGCSFRKATIEPCEPWASKSSRSGRRGLSTGGRAYTWSDAVVPPDGGPVQYWLEDVDLKGKSTWHGPIAPARDPKDK
jgi:hypothetical protein